MRRTDLQSMLVVAAGFAAATLTGFLRQAVLAQQIGAGFAADQFLVAFALPEFFFIALPIVFAPALIPVLARARAQSGDPAARIWAMKLLAQAALVLAGVITVLFLLVPQIVPWLSPGFDHLTQSRAIFMARCMLPGIWMMGMAALISAILQSYRSFARPAFVTAIYNATFCAALLLLSIADVGLRAALSVMIATIPALVIQLSVFLRTLDTSPSAVLPDEATQRYTRQFVLMMIPFGLGYLAHHLILWVDRAWATTLAPGDVAALSYANHIALVIVQATGLSVATVIFPALSERMAQSDGSSVRRLVWMSLGLTAATALPLALLTIVFREPLVRLLLERGAFDPSATARVGEFLVGYIIASLADALCQPLWRVLYAARAPWWVLAVNGTQTIMRLVVNWLLISTIGAMGIVYSAMIGLWFQATLLYILLPASIKWRPWARAAAN